MSYFFSRKESSSPQSIDKIKANLRLYQEIYDSLPDFNEEDYVCLKDEVVELGLEAPNFGYAVKLTPGKGHRLLEDESNLILAFSKEDKVYIKEYDARLYQKAPQGLQIPPTLSNFVQDRDIGRNFVRGAFVRPRKGYNLYVENTTSIGKMVSTKKLIEPWMILDSFDDGRVKLIGYFEDEKRLAIISTKYYFLAYY